MGAITRIWQTITDAVLQGGKPGDTLLFTALRDDIEYIKQWLGASYYAGAVQDHNHDGQNSALIEIGPNLLRNGSFESALSGWTTVAYAGGTIAESATGAVDGLKCLAITSTSITNGGGEALATPFIPVTAGRGYDFRVSVAASVVGVSSKAEVLWYDAAQAQISENTIGSFTSTPTNGSAFGATIRVPNAARYMRVKLIGGQPTIGSATGTIYFDGVTVAPTYAPVVVSSTTYAASGTYTRSANVRYIEVEVAGGGGAVFGAGTGRGGDGGLSREILYQTGATEAFTVGAGGTEQGANGGTSSFGSYLSATGGVSTQSSTDGAAGVGSGGDTNLTGGGGLGHAAGSVGPGAAGWVKITEYA